MRFSLAVGLVALAATANAAIDRRQSAGGSSAGSNATPGSSATGTTPSATPTPSSTSDTGSDSTTIITTTVTGDAKSTSTTTVGGSTKVTTLTDTSTVFSTTTVTSSDADVATRTVWETTTVQIDKRGVVPATATPAPALVSPLAKRAVKTSTTTVTVHPSVAIVTVTNDVVSTTVVTTTVTSTDTETSQANAKSTTTVTSTKTVSALVVTQTLSSTQSSPTGSPSTGGGGGGGGGGSSGGLSTGAKAGIGAGVGVAGLVIIAGAIFFCCRRRNRSPKPDPDMMAGASEVPVGGRRPMSHDSATAFRQAPARTPAMSAPEGYRGTAMGDGRAGYAKPESYGSSYGPSRSTTTTVPPTRTSGGADALPEHPSPGSEHVMAAVPNVVSPTVSSVSPPPTKHAAVAPPQSFAHELGTDNNLAANKWHSESAAEIDSQPVMGHQSGPVYEMPTENYR